MAGAGLPCSADVPPLSDVEVVRRILREFLAEVLRRVGDGDVASLLAWLDWEARCLNDLFLGAGESPDYARSPWHAPGQLGRHLAINLRMSCELRFAVRDALPNLLLRAAQSVDEGADPSSIPAAADDMAEVLCGRGR